MYLTPTIIDMYLDPKNNDFMWVKGIAYDEEKDDNILFNFDVKLNIKYMGIDWDGEFEDELYRDFKHAINDLYEKTGKYPDNESIRTEVEKNFYGMRNDSDNNSDISSKDSAEEYRAEGLNANNNTDQCYVVVETSRQLIHLRNWHKPTEELIITRKFLRNLLKKQNETIKSGQVVSLSCRAGEDKWIFNEILVKKAN